MTRRADGITIGGGRHGTQLLRADPSASGAKWVFNDPMFALLNLAVAGRGWSPDASTPFRRRCSSTG